METSLRIAALAATLCMLSPFTAFCATQGVLGGTSSGSLNFSVSKPARADITNLSDLRLPGWIIGDGPVVMTEDVCVYSTRPSGGYTVRATGSGAGGAFELSNGAHTMNYGVVWNAGGAGNLSNSGETLSHLSVSSAKTNAATDSSSCSGTTPGPTARLVVNISESEMSASPHGTYLGILTLLVTPN